MNAKFHQGGKNKSEMIDHHIGKQVDSEGQLAEAKHNFLEGWSQRKRGEKAEQAKCAEEGKRKLCIGPEQIGSSIGGKKFKICKADIQSGRDKVTCQEWDPPPSERNMPVWCYYHSITGTDWQQKAGSQLLPAKLVDSEGFARYAVFQEDCGFLPSHWDNKIARKITANPAIIRAVIFS